MICCLIRISSYSSVFSVLIVANALSYFDEYADDYLDRAQRADKTVLNMFNCSHYGAQIFITVLKNTPRVPFAAPSIIQSSSSANYIQGIRIDKYRHLFRYAEFCELNMAGRT